MRYIIAIIAICVSCVTAQAQFSGLHRQKGVEAISRQPKMNEDDALISCVAQGKQPIYGVGPKGFPKVGEVVTSEHFVIICINE